MSEKIVRPIGLQDLKGLVETVPNSLQEGLVYAPERGVYVHIYQKKAKTKLFKAEFFDQLGAIQSLKILPETAEFLDYHQKENHSVLSDSMIVVDEIRTMRNEDGKVRWTATKFEAARKATPLHTSRYLYWEQGEQRKKKSFQVDEKGFLIPSSNEQEQGKVFLLQRFGGLAHPYIVSREVPENIGQLEELFLKMVASDEARFLGTRKLVSAAKCEAALLTRIEDFVNSAIECGMIQDPGDESVQSSLNGLFELSLEYC